MARQSSPANLPQLHKGSDRQAVITSVQELLKKSLAIDASIASLEAELAALVVTAPVPSSRTLTAGAGLTGGGDLSADRTFNVGANADGSIVVNANDVQVGVISDTQHGSRGGGSLHALASSVSAGFLSSALFDKLTNLQAIYTIGTGLSLSSNILDNTGLLGVTAFDTSGPTTTGLSVTSQLVALTAATETRPGGVSATAQNFGGVKAFWVDGSNTTLATLGTNELRIDGRKGVAPMPPALKLLSAGSAVAQLISTTAGAVTLESLTTLTLKAAGVDSASVDGSGALTILAPGAAMPKLLLGLGGASIYADPSGTTDLFVNSTANIYNNAVDNIGNATHIWRLNGTNVMLLASGVFRPNFSGGLGLGSSSFPWGASYINSINGGTLSGNNSGDVTVGSVQATGNASALSLSGQSIRAHVATATTPGVIAASGSQTIGAQLQLPVGSTVAQASWIAATYQNSFTTFNASWFAAAYYKDSNGTVWIRGHVSRASAALNTAIFTLPAGYRPSKNIEFATDASDKFARLSVSSSGEVTIQAADSPIWYNNFSVQCSFDTRS